MQSQLSNLNHDKDAHTIKLTQATNSPPRVATHLFDTNRTITLFAIDIVFFVFAHLTLHYPQNLLEIFTNAKLLLLSAVAVFIWSISVTLWGAYIAYRPDRILGEIFRFVGAFTTGSLIIEGIYLTVEVPRLPYPEYVAVLFLAISILICIRVIFHYLVLMGKITFARNIAVIGTGKLSKLAVEKFKIERHIADKPIVFTGYISADDTLPNADIDRRQILGNCIDLGSIINRHAITDVIIAVDKLDDDKFESILNQLAILPVSIHYTPEYLETVLYEITRDDRKHKDLLDAISTLEPSTDLALRFLQIISLRTVVLTRPQYIFKRTLDLVIGGGALLAALPIMLVISALIWLYDRGPILYVHDRVGENGHHFKMYKFRSMVVNADKIQDKINRRDAEGHLIHKVPNDPRVTPIGHIIRKTSLDELPQLFNILRGDMSLIGPRPELPWLVQDYELWQLKRLSVPQGLTGWWQVNGRSDKPMHLNTAYDVYYTEHYSMALDINILLRTFKAVLDKTGAF